MNSLGQRRACLTVILIGVLTLAGLGTTAADDNPSGTSTPAQKNKDDDNPGANENAPPVRFPKVPYTLREYSPSTIRKIEVTVPHNPASDKLGIGCGIPFVAAAIFGLVYLIIRASEWVGRVRGVTPPRIVMGDMECWNYPDKVVLRHGLNEFAFILILGLVILTFTTSVLILLLVDTWDAIRGGSWWIVPLALVVYALFSFAGVALVMLALARRITRFTFDRATSEFRRGTEVICRAADLHLSYAEGLTVLSQGMLGPTTVRTYCLRLNPPGHTIPFSSAQTAKHWGQELAQLLNIEPDHIQWDPTKDNAAPDCKE